MRLYYGANQHYKQTARLSGKIPHWEVQWKSVTSREEPPASAALQGNYSTGDLSASSEHWPFPPNSWVKSTLVILGNEGTAWARASVSPLAAMIIYYNPGQGPQELEETVPSRWGSPSAARSPQRLPPPNGPENHDQRTFPFSILNLFIQLLKSHPTPAPLSYLFLFFPMKTNSLPMIPSLLDPISSNYSP